MMLATWLVEFYLSKCNELDDIVASESVSHDVDDLQAERTILEDDLRHFFETYKVGGRHSEQRDHYLTGFLRAIWTVTLFTNSFKDTDERTCICILRLSLATMSAWWSTTFSRKSGHKQ
jgi:hypothetical protein